MASAAAVVLEQVTIRNFRQLSGISRNEDVDGFPQQRGFVDDGKDNGNVGGANAKRCPPRIGGHNDGSARLGQEVLSRAIVVTGTIYSRSSANAKSPKGFTQLVTYATYLLFGNVQVRDKTTLSFQPGVAFSY